MSALSSSSSSSGGGGGGGLIVFTATFYARVDDVRCECCLASLRRASELGIRVVVVDASPDESVREAMRGCGSLVHKQVSKGKKGAALREALAVARDLAVSDDDWLCWQEPEKTDMLNHWRACALDGEADVVVPARDPDLFKQTYPIEQYFSESFANAYVSCAAKTFASFDAPLDWHFGPFMLRRRHANLWIANAGELWDAQVVPVIRAIHANLAVRSVTVPFRAPEAMRQQEEGDFAFCQKRLDQINFLDPILVLALQQPPNPDQC